MLNACDRLGMLVMDESFDMWTENKSSYDYALNFPKWREQDIKAMVDKDLTTLVLSCIPLGMRFRRLVVCMVQDGAEN